MKPENFRFTGKKMNAKRLFLFLLLLFPFNIYSQFLMKDCEHPDLATVVFFRPSGPANFPGSKFFYKIFFRDSLLTEARTTLFHVANLPQGNIRVNADRKDYKFSKNSKGFVEMKLLPGRVYFVKCGVQKDPGGTKALPKLRLLKKEEASKWIRRRFLKKRLKEKLFTDFKNLENL